MLELRVQKLQTCSIEGCRCSLHFKALPNDKTAGWPPFPSTKSLYMMKSGLSHFAIVAACDLFEATLGLHRWVVSAFAEEANLEGVEWSAREIEVYGSSARSAGAVSQLVGFWGSEDGKKPKEVSKKVANELFFFSFNFRRTMIYDVYSPKKWHYQFQAKSLWLPAMPHSFSRDGPDLALRRSLPDG